MAYIISRDGAGDTGGVWLVRALNGVSQGWSFLGGVIRGNPAVVAGLSGTAHVIARDPSNYPWVAILNGTEATWKGSPTAIDSAPSGIHVDNFVTVVAIRSGQVWSANFSVVPQSWGAWVPLGQTASSCSAASLQTSLMVAARDPSGLLFWYRPGVGWTNYGAAFSGGALSATPTGSATSLGSFSLTTSVSPSGGGSVSPTCPSACLYASGSQVQITATPAGGYQFSNFTGVDSSSGSVGYVTMNANRSVTANFTVSPPNITGISPTSGPVGTPVTIAGAGFGTSGTVTFNGTPAQQIDSWIPTSVIARVPAGATTGMISLSSGGYQTAFQQQFQVTPPGGTPPTISNLSLPSGPPQVGFDINGADFGSTQGTVTISGLSGGDRQLTIIDWNSVKVRVQVHASTPLGSGQVKVTTSGNSTSNQKPFTVSLAFGCNF